jgi:hypothetical protein
VEPLTINVVVFQDGDLWVAQAIEYDISARADSLPKLPHAFERALVANLSVNHELGRYGLDRIPSAPTRYREMFEAADLDIKPRAPSTMKAPVKIEEMRVAEAA